MASAEARPKIAVVVAWSPAAGQVEQDELTLPAGSTLLQAVQHSAWQRQHPGLDPATQKLGVWGSLCAPEQVLRNGDRVEIYRPLQLDPKDARRLRQQAAGKPAKRPASR